MAATIKDVAERAGVSIKTVSNVIHGNVYVSDSKRERVYAAIEALHYTPNLSARYLRRPQTGVLAFALPDLNNPYFWEVSQAVIAAAARQSYAVVLDYTHSQRENELDVINGLRPHLVDGIILNPLALTSDDLSRPPANLPVVLLGEHLQGAPYDNVVIDNMQAARQATEHLLSLGKQRIAAMRVQEDITGNTARQRLQGYAEALTAAGIELDPSLIVQANSYQREDGWMAMRQLLMQTPRPDAVLCFNDLIAIGAMRALHEASIAIPGEIALVGFDDIAEDRYTFPSLSSVAPDKQRIGELVVDLLLERIRGQQSGEPLCMQAPFTLQIRESSAG